MMIKRFFSIGVVCLCLMLVVVGCGIHNEDQIITPQKYRSIKYPVKIKDQSGNIVEITKEPKRIVSLAPSATEIAFALKLNQEIVAVTANDNYPPEVKKLPKVGDMNINIEQVLAQKPDLVLASTMNDQKTIEKLRGLKIPVLVIDGKSIKQIFKAIHNVALLTNRVWEAEQLIASMNKKMSQTVGRVVQVPKEKRVKVWIEIGPDLYTVGGDDYLNEIVNRAGGINVAEKEKGWPKISPEQVIQWKPDVIISVYGGDKAILKRKGWESVPAIQNKRVYSVDPDLVSRPGPRVPEGIEQLAKLFYPEKFGEGSK